MTATEIKGRKEGGWFQRNGFGQVQLQWHVTLWVGLTYSLSSTTSFHTWLLKVLFKRLWPLINLPSLKSYISWSHKETGHGVLWWGQEWMLQAWLSLGGNGRYKSYISTSLWKGRCWWSTALPHPAHTRLAVLTSLLSLGETLSWWSWFHHGKRNYWPLAIVIYVSAICERRHCCLSVWASCGLALSAASADTDPLACVEISVACVAQPTKPQDEDDVSENGLRVIYCPTVWASPTFSDKGLGISVMASMYLRKHLFAFSFSDNS